MKEKKPEFQSYEAINNRINALRSQIQHSDQQLSILKPINFLKKRYLRKFIKEDREKIKTLYDKTSVISTEDAISNAENQLSTQTEQKNNIE